MSTEARSLDPTVVTRADLASNTVVTHSAQFVMNIKTLADIANEFGVDRSNEKGATILRGCRELARKDVAERLAGRKFLIDRAGRELPVAVGTFSPEVLREIQDYIPSADNERFIPDLTGLRSDATRFKLFLKSVLLYGRVCYTNPGDDNLVVFQIDTEQDAGLGLIEALFRSGGEDRAINMSLTEVTNIRIAEDA